MSPTAKELMNMIDMLPEKEQSLAFEVIKRMVLAWDPDYTKLTNDEAQTLNTALDDMGDTVGHADINWN